MLHKDRLIAFPLTTEGVHKVESLVANIIAPHYGVELYATPEEKAIAYLYFLIKNHPFTDGNKRTAVLTFATVCMLNNLPLNDDFPPDALAVFIEKIREPDHQMVIRVIAREFFKK